MAGKKLPQNHHRDGTTRRGFIGAIGVAAAASALPAAASAAPAETVLAAGDGVLAGPQRWYNATLDAIVRGWEQRFRHRQYRRTEEDGADYETRESPQDELEDALDALPLLDDATARLVLAVTTQECGPYEPMRGQAVTVLARDVLDRAERFEYFARPCPEALRFPDLPTSGYMFDDVREAELDVERAQGMVNMTQNAREGFYTAEECAELGAKLDAAEKRLAAIRAGEVPALTGEEKQSRHAERRREIVRAYVARLEAAGHDASWVDVEGAGGRYDSEEAES